MKSKSLLPILVLIIIMCSPVITNSQTNPPDDPVDVPIDGGLSLLLAAGIGYGVKKAYSSSKKNVLDRERNGQH